MSGRIAAIVEFPPAACLRPAKQSKEQKRGATLADIFNRNEIYLSISKICAERSLSSCLFTQRVCFNPGSNGTVAWQVADALRATH